MKLLKLLKLPIIRIEFAEVIDKAVHGHPHMRRHMPHGTRHLHHVVHEGSAWTMSATKGVEERHEAVVFLKMLKTGR